MRLRIESQEHWQGRRLKLLPDSWLRPVELLFRGRSGSSDRDLAGANAWLRDATEPFERIMVPLGASDADLIDIAKRKAADMFALACSVPVTDTARLREMLADACTHTGIDPPGPLIADGPAVKRMTDGQWWRRKLRRVHGRHLEGAAIGFGFVHRHGQIYASGETVARRGQQKRRNARTLAESVAINEDGDALTLAELAARSVANPEIRRGELMTRIRGFEEVAAGVGHVGEFVTLTCPSRMHARLSVSGGLNPNYDGTTPRDAQRYLGQVWGRIRAALARRNVAPYGFRIAEPHHDGTPHWHMLLFVPAADRPALREVIAHHALADSPGEEGAATYRVKFTAIDAGQGTAAGYIAKYVAKNIDGYRVETDLFGNEAIESSRRVDAWASAWGIRQFQQVGGPPVGVWRELRRMREVPPKGEEGAYLEPARQAAEVGDWAGYVKANGGAICERRHRPLQLAYKEARRVDPNTQEVTPAVSRYGDPPRQVPAGVWEVFSGRVFSAVRHLWRVVSRAGAALVGFAVPWTRVNNCTGVEDGSGARCNADRAGGGSDSGGQLGVGADPCSGDGGRVGAADTESTFSNRGRPSGA